MLSFLYTREETLPPSEVLTEFITILSKLCDAQPVTLSIKAEIITKIVGNLEKTSYVFYVDIKETLPIEVYNAFILKLKKTFDKVEKLNVVFNVSNIDFELREYIENIDKYILDGNIISLDKKYKNSNDYKVLENITHFSMEDDYE